MQPSTLAKRVFPFAFLFTLLFYLYGLGQLPFVGPDEPRYAEVAREMFVRHDLITPTLGGHPWFEKPALLYWMIIGAFRLFGVSEWAARLGPAVCGLLTIGSIWFICSQVGEQNKRFRWVASFITATTLGLIVFARATSFDVVVTMTLAWAFAFFVSSEVKTKERVRRWMLFGLYFCVGLSLLAKGLVGIVIPFGVVTLYYAMRRQMPDRVVRKSLWWGIPLMIAVSALWYGPVTAKHGSTFIDQFFIQHHFARFISNKYHHPQRFYFYLPILALLTLPWTTILTEELARVRPRHWQVNTAEAKAQTLALAWLVFPVLFFSFSGSKLPGYILPGLPPAALLIARRINETSSKWTMAFAGLICISLGIAGVVYAARANVPSVSRAFLITSPLFVGGALAIVWSQTQELSLLTSGLGPVLTLVVVLHSVAPQIASGETVRDLLRRADESGYEQLPVFARAGSDRTAEFYAAGRVVYDSEGEPIALDEFPKMRAAARSHGGQILVFVPADYVDLVKRIPDMKTVGATGEVALILVDVR